MRIEYYMHIRYILYILCTRIYVHLCIVYIYCYVYVYVDWSQLIIIMMCHIECHIHSNRPVCTFYTPRIHVDRRPIKRVVSSQPPSTVAQPPLCRTTTTTVLRMLARPERQLLHL